ncbi:MAG: hypothetical protein Phyf2KO_12510 [Phycisphaerales bacterium]
MGTITAGTTRVVTTATQTTAGEYAERPVMHFDILFAKKVERKRRESDKVSHAPARTPAFTLLTHLSGARG